MNANNIIVHGVYAIVAAGTFFAGSYWARPDQGGGAGRGGFGAVGSGGPLVELSALPPKRGPSAGGPVELGAAIGSGAESMPALLAPWMASTIDEEGPLSDEQIKALVLLATKSRDPVERRRAFDRILREMRSDTFSVEQAMVMRAAMAGAGADGEQWKLFDYAWGANDPAAALAHIDEIAAEHRRGFTSNMLPGLASVDPQAAIQLVAGMEGSLRQHLTGRLIEGLVDRDPALATEYVNRLAGAGDPNATRHMARVAQEVLRSAGFERGKAWAEALPEGALKSAALVPIANAYTKRDPKGAADWAGQYIGTEHSRIFGEVVRQWGDLDAASAWVDSLPQGRAQQDGLSAVWGFLGSRQPQAAARQILTMPPSTERNFIINGFISGLAHSDGEAAVIWAGEITSPGMRASAQIRAAKQFYKQDPQGASRWFETSGLPESAWPQVTGDPG